MSRIGKKPIVIPAGVKVACTGALVQVEGPKGKLQHECPSEVTVEISDGEVLVKRSSDNQKWAMKTVNAGPVVNNKDVTPLD